MTHILQMYSDVACTAWNFKFASAMFTTSTIVFLLLWTKNRSQSFFNLIETKYTLKKVHLLANKLETIKIFTRPF